MKLKKKKKKKKIGVYKKNKNYINGAMTAIKSKLEQKAENENANISFKSLKKDKTKSLFYQVRTIRNT